MATSQSQLNMLKQSAMSTAEHMCIKVRVYTEVILSLCRCQEDREHEARKHAHLRVLVLVGSKGALPLLLGSCSLLLGVAKELVDLRRHLKFAVVPPAMHSQPCSSYHE